MYFRRLMILFIFNLMWKFSCGDLNKFPINTVNQHAHILSLSINFILKNITATDVRVMGSKSFFQHNFTDFENQWRDSPVTLYNMDSRTSWMQPNYPMFAVIVIYLEKNLQESIKSLKHFWVEKRKNKIILVTNNCEPMGSIIEFSALFWSLEMLNFLILNSCNDVTNLYTYFPFGNNQCKLFNEINIINVGSLHKDLTETVFFISEYEHKAKEFSSNSLSALPFFPDKIPLDLKHCPIKTSSCFWPPNVINVSSIDEAGTEVEFIKIIEKHINCSVTYVTVSKEEVGIRYGTNEDNVGQLAMLKGEIYDLIFGAVPLHANLHREFDVTDCFQDNYLTFLVPKAGVRPNSTILWILFEKHIIFFLVILGSVGILSIMVNGMLKLSTETKTSKPTKSNSFFVLNISGTLLRSLIETSTPIIPENRIIRWVYGTWFASSLIITSYFNTTLITYFTEPGYFEQIKTVDDIIDSKIPISINEIYYPMFLVMPEYMATYFKLKSVKVPVSMGLKLASMGKAVTVTDVVRAEYLSIQWVSNNGQSSIYYLYSDFMIQFYNIMVMYKGNPLMERITEIMRKIK